MNYFTLVGSRDTPEDSCEILEHMAAYLAIFKGDWIGRSGGANGADSALETSLLKVPHMMEVYLPWTNFNDRVAGRRSHWIDTPKLTNYQEAMLIAEDTHPAWDRCSRGARALHTRNVYQVLGKDLNTPSKILICWAVPTKDGVKGGTNTAVQLAKKYGCHILNIYGMDDNTAMSKLKELL